MSHQTQSTDILGHVEKRKPMGDKILYTGWCFYAPYTNVEFSTRIRSKKMVMELKQYERLDVALSFKNPTIINCGWEFIANVAETYILEMNVENTWKPVFTFIGTDDMPGGDAAEVEASPNPFTAVCKFAKSIPSFVVVDNFYEDPHAVREFGLRQQFKENKKYHKGHRTEQWFRTLEMKARFEHILGTKIRNWENYVTNGCFQYCVAGDSLVFHLDLQEYAGLCYLSPDAPIGTGTNFYRSKHTKKMTVADEELPVVFRNGFLDQTEFELVDSVGNVFNRLILFNSKLIHAATQYFGTTKDNGRFFQLFFFDIDRSTE